MAHPGSGWVSASPETPSSMNSGTSAFIEKSRSLDETCNEPWASAWQIAAMAARTILQAELVVIPSLL